VENENEDWRGMVRGSRLRRSEYARRRERRTGAGRRERRRSSRSAIANDDDHPLVDRLPLLRVKHIISSCRLSHHRQGRLRTQL